MSRSRRMRYSSPRISTSIARVGREQHAVALLDVAHGRADRDHLGPREPPVDVRGGGDQDARRGLAVAVLVGRPDENAVGRHGNRVLDGTVTGLGHSGQGTARDDGQLFTVHAPDVHRDRRGEERDLEPGDVPQDASRRLHDEPEGTTFLRWHELGAAISNGTRLSSTPVPLHVLAVRHPPTTRTLPVGPVCRAHAPRRPVGQARVPAPRAGRAHADRTMRTPPHRDSTRPLVEAVTERSDYLNCSRYAPPARAVPRALPPGAPAGDLDRPLAGPPGRDGRLGARVHRRRSSPPVRRPRPREAPDR